jgi:hypothetical protein
MYNTLTPLATQNSETWGGLRRAITSTPGFQHWCSSSRYVSDKELDDLIQLYLRETLETLAY